MLRLILILALGFYAWGDSDSEDDERYPITKVTPGWYGCASPGIEVFRIFRNPEFDDHGHLISISTNTGNFAPDKKLKCFQNACEKDEYRALIRKDGKITFWQFVGKVLPPERTERGTVIFRVGEPDWQRSVCTPGRAPAIPISIG